MIIYLLVREENLRLRFLSFSLRFLCVLSVSAVQLSNQIPAETQRTQRKRREILKSAATIALSLKISDC
jgi:hypothetical protein